MKTKTRTRMKKMTMQRDYRQLHASSPEDWQQCGGVIRRRQVAIRYGLKVGSLLTRCFSTLASNLCITNQLVLRRDGWQPRQSGGPMSARVCCGKPGAAAPDPAAGPLFKFSSNCSILSVRS